MSQCDQKKVFVTVGTTEFPELIETMSSKEIRTTLLKLGYNTVQLQTGTSKLEPYKSDEEPIHYYYNDYYEDFKSEIRKADLVISHAGAGTCLDVLAAKKKLIVVINDKLMDNHQVDLAEMLQKEGYLYYCTCATLNETLQKDLGELKTYPQANLHAFADYLNSCVRFE